MNSELTDEAKEDKFIEKKLIPLLKKTIEQRYLTGTTYRDTHSKGHAVVRAEFKVEPNLPEELSVGLFSKPKTYQAWARFSNLSISPQKDIEKDVRACSFKLMDVDGKMLWQSSKEARTMDFTMMGSPTFLTSDLPTFYKMQSAVNRGGLPLVWFMLTHPRIARTIIEGNTLCASVLEIPFYSQTAYQFGDRVVQYHMKPLTEKISDMPDKPAPNFLRERLLADLEEEAAEFEFMVQFQKDEETMPIEDPMVEWKESESPYRKVATLRILRQKDITSPEQTKFCENISFNCWRTLEEHKPLGSINRARLKVYQAIAKFRRDRNAVCEEDRKEPTPDFNP